MNSRAPISRNIARARISGFSFLDFSHAVRSRSRPVTEIFREKKRASELEEEEEAEEQTIARLLDGYRDSSHFHEDRPNSLFAHRLPRISSMHHRHMLIYTERLGIIGIIASLLRILDSLTDCLAEIVI